MSKLEKTVINVGLSGLADIMFDRFIDYSTEKRPPEQKLYLAEKNQVVLPADNILYFMFAQDPPGCAKTFEGKSSKDYMRVGLSHIFVSPTLIPLLDEKSKPIFFKEFGAKLYVDYSSPRVKKGGISIKQEAKARPVLKLPWNIEFKITIVKNNIINEVKLSNWFTKGGLEIALGTYRPRYGRFDISKWEIEK